MTQADHSVDIASLEYATAHLPFFCALIGDIKLYNIPNIPLFVSTDQHFYEYTDCFPIYATPCWWGINDAQ